MGFLRAIFGGAAFAVFGVVLFVLGLVLKVVGILAMVAIGYMILALFGVVPPVDYVPVVPYV